MLSNEWKSALEFTQKQGLKTPPLPPESISKRRFISSALSKGLLEKLKPQYENKPIDQFILKCFNVHDFIYNCLYDDFKTPCYLTIGWVEAKGHPYFKHSQEEAGAWIKKGVPNVHDVHLHCWITFPSGEMLDATLPSVLAINHQTPSSIGEIFWLESEQSEMYIYHPTLIGYEAIKALKLGE